MTITRLPVVWVLGGWIAVTALIALNRGVDLLWGMVALLLAALCVAFVLPHLQLRLLSVTRRMPAEGHVGEPLRLEYDVHVRGPLACYGIELHEALEPGVPGAAAFLPRVAGRGTYRYEWEPQTRGRRRLGAIVLETGFPLGLTRARRRIVLPEHEVTVYPGRSRLARLPIDGGADPVAERLTTQRRGGSEEFFGLKSYRPGDDLRTVHWRASARCGELLVREFEHFQDRELWVLLDQHRGAHAGAGRHSTGEYMFHVAHSAIVAARAQGVPVGMVYRGNGLQRIEPGTDARSYARMRDVLATVELDHGPTLDTWLASERERLPRGGAWLVFNAAGVAARGALRGVMQQRRARGLVVEFAQASFASDAPEQPVPIALGGDADCRVYTLACGADLGELFAAR